MIACARCKGLTSATIVSQLTGERLCQACREDERAALYTVGLRWGTSYRWRRRGSVPLVRAFCTKRLEERRLGALTRVGGVGR